MTLPYININGTKIAPFKTPNVEPYGPFANTTDPGLYPISEQIIIDGTTKTFNWPSSEHAFHAQKIIHLKNKLAPQHPAQSILTQILNEIEATNKPFLPRDEYDPLVNKYLPQLNRCGLALKNKYAFDALCDADYHVKHNPQGKKETINFMRAVVHLKLAQHPQLRAKAIECAKQGIIPVEISRYDDNWASGLDGTGLNMLGTLILEEGNRLLIQQGDTPAIPNPQQTYEHFKRNNSQRVAHNALAHLLVPGGTDWTLSQTGKGQGYKKVALSQVKSSSVAPSSSTMNISMMVLGGFIAAAGITAVAIAFTLLNAATFGITGLVVAGIGVAAVLAGAGLFSTGVYKNRETTLPMAKGIGVDCTGNLC